MADNLFYNPFLRIKEDTIRKLMAMGKPHVVIQRFQWPGQPLQKTFLLSAYEQEYEAHLHERELRSNEGKAQNLLDLTQYQNIIKLLKPAEGIGVFLPVPLMRNMKHVCKKPMPKPFQRISIISA
ncbi:hypothetical protein ACRQ5D_31415 [Mucilaginibacter sp. P25]|uniref:hypothetical protein n=1 Tax=Mucilaginibacter sp. P25 TaxID=3423945 RepID=UPI003D78E5BF